MYIDLNNLYYLIMRIESRDILKGDRYYPCSSWLHDFVFSCCFIMISLINKYIHLPADKVRNNRLL